MIFARAKLAYRMRACAPRIVERGLYLRKARHPLLDPDRAVANDLMLGEDFDTLVITGPNTGGKTVTIKPSACSPSWPSAACISPSPTTAG